MAHELGFPENEKENTGVTSNAFISAQRESRIFEALTEFCNNVTPGEFAVAKISYCGEESQRGTQDTQIYTYPSKVNDSKGGPVSQSTECVSNFQHIEYSLVWKPKTGTWKDAWAKVPGKARTANKKKLVEILSWNPAQTANTEGGDNALFG